LAIGLAAGGDSGADWLTPSVANKGPKGLAVLSTWLQEGHVQVEQGLKPLTQIPPGIASVLLPAPSARTIDEDEVRVLKTFVKKGGTLVYLAPRTKLQPHLESWLHVSAGPMLPVKDAPMAGDLTGATVKVALPAGLLSDTSALRVQLDRTVKVDDDAAVPMTEPKAVWFLKLGQGEVWVAAGPDLAESGRLSLLDNATFWRHLAARGPLLVDEYHHSAAQTPLLPASVKAPLLQAVFLAVLVLAAWGRRQGPPRPSEQTVHRSTVETAEAAASLTQRFGLDAAVATEIRNSTLATLRTQLGLAPSTAPAEVVAVSAERLGIPAPELAPLARADSNLLDVSRAAALLD
jgi:hypothetical protein